MLFTIITLLFFIVISIYYTTKMFAGDYDDPIKGRVTWYWSIFMAVFFWGSFLSIDLNVIFATESMVIIGLLFVFILAKIIEAVSYFIRSIIRRDILFWKRVESFVGYEIPDDKRRWFMNKYVNFSPVPKMIAGPLIIISVMFSKYISPFDDQGISYIISAVFAVEMAMIILQYYLFYRAKSVFRDGIPV